MRLDIAESNPAEVSRLFLMDEVFCRSIHVQALSKTNSGTISNPYFPLLKYSPKGEKNRNFCRTIEGTRAEEITDFEHGRRMFWGT